MTTHCSGHLDIIHRLAKLDKAEKLAHAYLFIGAEFVGKLETAIDMSKYINCLDRKDDMFCNECANCKRIDDNSFPDVHIIEAEEGSKIKIEQIREMLDQIRLRPFVSSRKIFILKDVHLVTIEGTNAILKTLEEPTDKSLILLTTSSEELVVDTVKSRCHKINFPSLSKNEIENKLRNELSEDSPEVHFLASLSEGCYGKASRLLNEKFFNKKNKIIDEFVFTYDSEAYVKKTLSDKDEAKVFLDVLLSWIRDAILVKSSVEDDRIIHLDRINEMKSFQLKFSFEELTEIYGSIAKIKKMLADNLNVKVPIMILKEKIWVN